MTSSPDDKAVVIPSAAAKEGEAEEEEEEGGNSVDRWSSEIRAAIEFEEDPHKAALDDNPELVYIGPRTWAAIFALSLGLGAPIGLSFMTIAVVADKITAELGAPEQASWVLGTWSIANACSAAVAGNLSDTFGRRNVILVGDLIILVASILGATARSIEVLLIAQTLMGVGAGFAFDAFAAVPEMLPNKWRALGAGIVEGGVHVPWATVCAVLANAVTRYASWRWIYYICIMQSFITFKATALLYWPVSRPRGDFHKTRWQQIKELDYIGICSITGGLVALTCGLTWGGVTFPWNHPGSIVPIALGFLAIVVGFAYDWTWCKHPMVPLNLFWPRVMFRRYISILIVLFISGMNFHALSHLIPQGVTLMFTTDGVENGILSLPSTIMQLVLGFLMPLIAHRIPDFIPGLTIKWQLVMGTFFQALFLGVSALSVNPNNQTAFAFLPAFGVPNFTWVTVLSYAVTGLHVPHSQLGTALGLLGAFRSAGGAVGNALFGTLFGMLATRATSSKVQKACQELGLCPNAAALDSLLDSLMAYNQGAADGDGNGAADGILAGLDMETRDILQRALRTGYGRAMQIIFLATIPLSVLALVCSLWIEDPTPYMNNHVQFRMYERGGFSAKMDPEAPALTGATVLSTLRKKRSGETAGGDQHYELGRVNSQGSRANLTKKSEICASEHEGSVEEVR